MERHGQESKSGSQTSGHKGPEATVLSVPGHGWGVAVFWSAFLPPGGFRRFWGGRASAATVARCGQGWARLSQPTEPASRARAGLLVTRERSLCRTVNKPEGPGFKPAWEGAGGAPALLSAAH